MAKELPYFKFEPNAWENGNIQLCNRESKGLFIEICSIYWSRLGELPYALALQKLCNGNKYAMQELELNQIFSVNEGQIVIEFLDEQLNEFQNTSEKRRKAANKRWNDASALHKQSKSNAIREDKKREDKKREDKIVFPFDSENFKNQWNIWKDFKKKEFNFSYKSVQSEQAALSELSNLSETNETEAIKIIHQSLANGWKGFFKLKENGKQKGNTDFQNALRNYKSKIE